MVVVLGGREEDKQVNVRWSVGDGCVGGGRGWFSLAGTDCAYMCRCDKNCGGCNRLCILCVQNTLALGHQTYVVYEAARVVN